MAKQRTWKEGNVEFAVCPVCGDTCNTHNDASNPLTFCGDCGLGCCSKCCDESSATRCENCRRAKAVAR